MDSLLNKVNEFTEHGKKPVAGVDTLPPGNKAHGGAYPAGGGFFSLHDDDDDDEVTAEEASRRAGASGDSSLFSTVLGTLGQKKTKIAEEEDDIDEEDAIDKHKKHYGDSVDHEADERSLGTAAAMQALKLFTKGETGDKQGKSTFLALAMSEATKLFDDKSSKGKVTPGASKQTATQKACETAFKMYVKSQGQQAGAGPGTGTGAGGPSKLMSLASKFL